MAADESLVQSVELCSEFLKTPTYIYLWTEVLKETTAVALWLKKWFTTYETVQEGGSVLMGDNTPRKIAGIGSIQIKMADGITRTLTDVRHIPTMTRNLISLSTLDPKGYKYSAEGGVLKVSRGSLVVMKGDMKSANLYLLRGTAITEETEGNAEPSTYSEAISSINSNNWVIAMNDEMESLEKNVSKITNRKETNPLQMDFQKEGISPSEEMRYKTRLVAKGYSQISGIDYNDVFSPVVKHSSIRTLFSIVAMHDYELEQLDVKTAFLHGELEKDIYMDQSEGFVFVLYVDDMLIAAKDKNKITKLKAQLNSKFEMKDLGAAKKILGMEITRERHVGKLYLSQKGYIKKVLRRFNMHEAKSVSTPLAAYFRLSLAMCPQSDKDVEYMSKVPTQAQLVL
ncbi:hypothetical protein U9M48_036131 [Paspalum notatum var. saurae]|uniref:Reverse transcriptase Ty1/copia-type domain-containing protein n=1 Tax=Paspalum notatum var. saurae TaxID=547442 RepID=A0AAQ3X862_PASNO